MAGRFSPQFIEDLLSRIDIVDLIDARVKLKHSGTNSIACCPFHNEKTPSFTVNRSKQFYHCFGCGAHGDAIAFLMAFDNLAFPEAVTSLALTAGMDLPGNEAEDAKVTAERRRATRLFEIQARAAQFYANQLQSAAMGRRAAEYLARRGINPSSIERYQIGYAPAGWKNLPQNWDTDDLRGAGLSIERENSRYERFRDRIMFPIRDRRGRTVAFGGRALDDGTPKYLNSPETPIFKKHREVYGLFEALQTERNPAQITVVEGYLDVISLAQFGLTSTVATLGTATSAEHISLLFRFCDELVFCFDGDPAGIKAAWKALLAALTAIPDGKTARFLRLPEREDPDSLVRKEGPDAFRARIGSARPLSDYFFSELTGKVDLATIEGRARLIKLATPLLQQIQPGSFRQMMLAQLRDLTARPQAAPRARPSAERSNRAIRLRPSASLHMLSLLAANPRLAGRIDPETRACAAEHPQTGHLFSQIVDYLQSHPEAGTDELRNNLLNKSGSQDGQLQQLFNLEIAIPETGLEAEFDGCLRKLLASELTRRFEMLIDAARVRTLSVAERDNMRQLDELKRKLESRELSATERIALRTLLDTPTAP